MVLSLNQFCTVMSHVMLNKLSSQEVSFLCRVAQSEEDLDVTSLMYELKLTPATVAHFTKRLLARNLVTLDGFRIKATPEGRDEALKLSLKDRHPNEQPWRTVPENRRKPAVPAFAPYLPRKSDVDPEILANELTKRRR